MFSILLLLCVAGVEGTQVKILGTSVDGDRIIVGCSDTRIGLQYRESQVVFGSAEEKVTGLVNFTRNGYITDCGYGEPRVYESPGQLSLMGLRGGETNWRCYGSDERCDGPQIPTIVGSHSFLTGGHDDDIIKNLPNGVHPLWGNLDNWPERNITLREHIILANFDYDKADTSWPFITHYDSVAKYMNAFIIGLKSFERLRYINFKNPGWLPLSGEVLIIHQIPKNAQSLSWDPDKVIIGSACKNTYQTVVMRGEFLEGEGVDIPSEIFYGGRPVKLTIFDRKRAKEAYMAILPIEKPGDHINKYYRLPMTPVINSLPISCEVPPLGFNFMKSVLQGGLTTNCRDDDPRCLTYKTMVPIVEAFYKNPCGCVEEINTCYHKEMPDVKASVTLPINQEPYYCTVGGSVSPPWSPNQCNSINLLNVVRSSSEPKYHITCAAPPSDCGSEVYVGYYTIKEASPVIKNSYEDWIEHKLFKEKVSEVACFIKKTDGVYLLAGSMTPEMYFNSIAANRIRCGFKEDDTTVSCYTEPNIPHALYYKYADDEKGIIYKGTGESLSGSSEHVLSATKQTISTNYTCLCGGTSEGYDKEIALYTNMSVTPEENNVVLFENEGVVGCAFSYSDDMYPIKFGNLVVMTVNTNGSLTNINSIEFANTGGPILAKFNVTDILTSPDLKYLRFKCSSDDYVLFMFPNEGDFLKKSFLTRVYEYTYLPTIESNTELLFPENFIPITTTATVYTTSMPTSTPKASSTTQKTTITTTPTPKTSTTVMTTDSTIEATTPSVVVMTTNGKTTPNDVMTTKPVKSSTTNGFIIEKDTRERQGQDFIQNVDIKVLENGEVGEVDKEPIHSMVKDGVQVLAIVSMVAAGVIIFLSLTAILAICVFQRY